MDDMNGMNGNAKLNKMAKSVIPHGVNSPVRYYDPYPFFATRAQGCHIWDADGNRMMDLCNGYGSMLLGHRHPDVIRAVANQLESGTLYCVPTEMETRVSAMIRDAYPSMQLSRMVNTGSEATMSAIRLARGHTDRSRIIMFEGGYHGAHDSVLVRAGSGVAHIPDASSAGIPGNIPGNTLLARYNDSDGLADIIESNRDIAAVIVEPVMANMGLIPPEPHFLDAIRHITRQNDIVLIFDEVVTGFRMSPGGAQSYYSVTPDITTLAKSMGNGFAVAAVGGHRDIMERLAPVGDVYQASTFAGNPIAAAAAAASMHVMMQNAGTIYGPLERRCAAISSAISDAAADLHVPCRVNHVSSMLQAFFADEPVRNYDTARRADAALFRRLFDNLMDRRIFVAPSQFETVFLSTALDDSDISYVCESYAESIKDMS